MKYIVASGLTRRLVEADSPYDAMQAVLSDKLLYRHLDIAPDDLHVEEATLDEIARFTRAKKKPSTDQLAMQLDDTRKAGKTSGKDHA